MAMIVYELAGADERACFSPHCWKTIWSLAHKGLEFERRPVRFTEIAGLGLKTLPAIRDGDTLVSDSFDIAVYLEETYPDRPSLFGGEGGRAAARFIERWTIAMVHAALGGALLMDIHACLGADDRAYFRQSREARFGGTLEAVSATRDTRIANMRAGLAPLRNTLEMQPFLGGGQALFSDYLVAGAFQWARVVSPEPILERDDPIAAWFDRVLDLYDGLGRQTQTAKAA